MAIIKGNQKFTLMVDSQESDKNKVDDIKNRLSSKSNGIKFSFQRMGGTDNYHILVKVDPSDCTPILSMIKDEILENKENEK